MPEDPKGTLGHPDYANQPKYTNFKLVDQLIEAFKNQGKKPVLKAAEEAALGMSGRIEPVDLGSEAATAADFLRRAFPDLQKMRTINKYDNSLIGKDVIPYNELARRVKANYLNTINNWLEGATNMYRQLPTGSHTPTPSNIRDIEALTELYNASKNKSVGALWRGATTQEIPNLKEGETFYNPFASYTVNPLKAVNWSPGVDNAVTLKLEPGAKTLPIAAVGNKNFASELEHIASGEFRIKKIINNSLRPIVSVEQVNPNPANPVKPYSDLWGQWK